MLKAAVLKRFVRADLILVDHSAFFSMAECSEVAHLFEKNAAWAARMRARDLQFFERLRQQQSPRYLWIGCSDSRVPANQIVDLPPGEIFVHRNIGNLVVHTDLNCLSVLQFGIDVLQLRNVIVCGHYGCSGVRAALEQERHGLVDSWLRNIQYVREKHDTELGFLADAEVRARRLCELNVIEQVKNIARTETALNAWAQSRPLAIHGWIYDVGNGLLQDLGATISRAE